MTNPAGPQDLASLLSAPGPTPTLQLARYRRWLDQAHASAGSAVLRQLISEVSDELHQLATAGGNAIDDLQDVVLGVFESILVAFDVEAAASA